MYQEGYHINREEGYVHYNRTMDCILQVLHNSDKEEFSVNEIVDRVPYERDAVSRNLGRLKESNLIIKDESTRPHAIRINEDYKQVIYSFSSRFSDEKSIKHTKPQNTSVKINLDGEKSYKTAVYHGLEDNSILEEEIVIGEEKVSMDKLLGKIIRKIEEEKTIELEDYASEIYDDLLEEYDVREELESTEKVTIIKSFLKGVKKNPEEMESSHKIFLPLHDKKPKYLLLKHGASIFLHLEDSIGMEDIEDVLSEIKLETMKPQISDTISYEEVKASLDVALEQIDVFTNEELEFLEELLQQIEHKYDGETILTVSKDARLFSSSDVAHRIQNS